MEPKTDTTNDESTLDAELEASIESIKAGNTLEATPKSETTTQNPIEGGNPTVQKSVEGEKPSDSQPTAEEQEFRIPNKGKFETDEAYEKRVELFDLVKRKKAATTPEAQQHLSEQIKQTKTELKSLGSTERFNSQKAEENNSEQVDPELQSDKDRLRQLGGATKEDVAEIVRQERLQQEVQSTLQNFVGEIPELKDPDVREVFFDFVENNYVWQGKSGKELLATLGMAYEAMFRPSESIQERVLKGASVAEKVNAMQFPGVTGSKTTFSSEMQSSIDQLKATGMSEEKAIELLTE